ncbi:hypothetical protein C2S51_027192 [Perilla frutescens var. frutescens]|nr:hypothetical protein C2S51_027192 [Perilla frutescens var. frutescens]
MAPRTRRSIVRKNSNHGLRDEEIEEYEQQSGQQQNLETSQQPIEKRVMTSTTVRPTAPRKSNHELRDEQIEEYEQQSGQQQNLKSAASAVQGKKRRHWRSRVKNQCFIPTLPIENQVHNRPIRVNEDQWKNLLPYWIKEDVKKISDKNKDHQRCSVMKHTTGKLSFAEIEEELKE